RRRGVIGHIDSESHYIWMRTGHEWRDDLSGEFSFGLAYSALHRSGNLDDGAGNLSYVDDRQHSQTSDLHGTLHWSPDLDQRVEIGTGITWGDARYRYRNEIALDPMIAALFGKRTQSSRLLRHAAQR